MVSTETTLLELLVSATQGGRKERVTTMFQEVAKFTICLEEVFTKFYLSPRSRSQLGERLR